MVETKSTWEMINDVASVLASAKNTVRGAYGTELTQMHARVEQMLSSIKMNNASVWELMGKKYFVDSTVNSTEVIRTTWTHVKCFSPYISYDKIRSDLKKRSNISSTLHEMFVESCEGQQLASFLDSDIPDSVLHAFDYNSYINDCEHVYPGIDLKESKHYQKWYVKQTIPIVNYNRNIQVTVISHYIYAVLREMFDEARLRE